MQVGGRHLVFNSWSKCGVDSSAEPFASKEPHVPLDELHLRLLGQVM